MRIDKQGIESCAGLDWRGGIPGCSLRGLRGGKEGRLLFLGCHSGQPGRRAGGPDP